MSTYEVLREAALFAPEGNIYRFLAEYPAAYNALMEIRDRVGEWGETTREDRDICRRMLCLLLAYAEES